MIDWVAFLIVALTSLVAAALVVTLYALGLRLTSRRGATQRLSRILGIGCFVLSAVAVLFGIYLVVPALH
jgi:hypothetical protein